MTQRADVLRILARFPNGMTDAEVAQELARLHPRATHQTANQLCRQLANEGVIARDDNDRPILNRLRTSGERPTENLRRAASRQPRPHAVEAGSGASGGSPTATRSSRSRFESGACAVRDSLEVRIAFTWLSPGDVSLDATGLPRFPPLPRAPGLYRFDFGLDAHGVRSLYIGESVELARRASNYRNAKSDRSRQRTSRRIHKEIVEHLTGGGTIEFAIATEVRLGNDVVADLRLKSTRRLAENAAVLSAQTTPQTRVLNIDADLGTDDSEA